MHAIKRLLSSKENLGIFWCKTEDHCSQLLNYRQYW